MEPKIVGDRVGLHPLVTLMSMVLGTYLFGGIGLLGLPITVALLHALNKQGAIHLYRTSDGEPECAEAPGEYDAVSGGATVSAPETAPLPETKPQEKSKKAKKK